ncbi:hypothetical protein PHLGIDRAFT_11795 [Phlebiopsis gigantea 11061_1 CR5-6]|uniref:PH domain-containing protein n=1 Tax=Phlebiopsis gigantea (strain 11061_1 CR5-6) TaxID=745531 RepID=A0A0C3NW92_PHLG1|nr:hypothetical protein PHLGIDRAFT_11795 [Phlebiopsis gigantea 11061_1 CR5-6]
MFGPRSTSPVSQFSIDSYLSTYIPSGDFDTHASPSTEDTCSSPEPSFPPTPQLSANTPSFFNRSYSSLFSHQEQTSIFEDLASTLEYDYSHRTSQLGPSPPAREPGLALSLEDDDGCDFEPGTSAQTIRRLVRTPSTSHFRSSSTESRALDGFSHMDSCALSPTTPSFADSESSHTSSASSEFDSGDFLTTYSDSSDEDFLTAPLSRSSSLAGSASQQCDPHAEDAPNDGRQELSESSGVDITARLSRLSSLSQSDVGSSRYVSAHEYMDSADDGYRGGGRSQGRQNESSRQGESSRGQASHSGYGGGSAPSGGFGGGSGGGRRDGDGDDDRYRRPQPRQSAPAYTDSDTSESEESDGEDDTPRRTKPRQPQPVSSSSADDDVPLAQQIPTALKAQRTIRRQVHDEAVERRRARSLRRPARPSMSPQPPLQELPSPPVVSHSLQTPSISRHMGLSEAPKAVGPPEAPKPVGRPRTRTMPSQSSSPFSVGELTKRLLGTQTTTSPPLPVPHAVSSRRTSHDPSPLPVSPKLPASRLVPNHHEQHPVLANPPQETISTMQRLRSMRSFHRPRTTAGDDLPPPIPSGGAQLGRSATSASRRHPDSQPATALAQPFREREGRSSVERTRSTRSQSRRPSVDRDRSVRPSFDQDARPPLPPLPAPGAIKMHTAWQQRFFVGSLQRFSQVEISSASTARDVLVILQNQGALEDGAASGWMIWEVSQDFGMERPIRSFEVLADVCNSWLADKTVNVLMAKKTPLAPKLSRAAIPSSSPVCGGFVQHEYKRGKWQKRWLELREHSLWLSKRDNGKDQIQLCSLSNFDAYIVTRVSKAPKAYIFAVKSTDNLSFFESTADYVHVFSCDKKDGENWLEKILLARSYVLHQERNVLTTATAPVSIVGASLSRSGTRKRPAQPLVNFGAAGASVPSDAPPTTPLPVFEPGSLLAKRS